MEHLGTQTIETPRLILRRFRVEDAGAMYRNWGSVPAVTKFMTWPVHGSVEESRRILAEWVRQYESDDVYQWAITLREEGDEAIGGISVVRLEDAIQGAEVGYCIGKAWWSRGVTTEALAAVLEFLFIQVGVNRVEAKHDTENIASGRVMIKCGMRRESVRRDGGRNNQGIRDMAVYSILKREYAVEIRE